MLKERTDQIHPVVWVPSAYFAMGLPFVTIALVVGIMYKNMGISDSQITVWDRFNCFTVDIKTVVESHS